MTDKITKPGVYYDITNEAYHGDCCDAPSLSSSGARALIEECPAAFWWNSYLNPDYEPENKKVFDLGTAAHTALLEPETWEGRIVVIDAANYQTKAAKEARDAAWAAGKTPLLADQRDAIAAMRDALMAHPLASKAWQQGHAESSYFWHPEGYDGLWLKCRPDFMPDHGQWIIDYKTTTSANPRAFTKRVWDLGYFQSAAWYIDGVEAVTGRAPEEWWFVVQEVKPPYLVSVFLLDMRAIEWGRILNRRAVALFAKCLATDTWPGYGETAQMIGLPTWAEFQLEERHQAGEFETHPSQEQKRIAMEVQAP